MSTTQTDDEFERAREVGRATHIIADERDPERLERAGWLLIGLSRQAKGVNVPEEAQEVLDDE